MKAFAIIVIVMIIIWLVQVIEEHYKGPMPPEKHADSDNFD